MRSLSRQRVERAIGSERDNIIDPDGLQDDQSVAALANSPLVIRPPVDFEIYDDEAVFQTTLYPSTCAICKDDEDRLEEGQTFCFVHHERTPYSVHTSCALTYWSDETVDKKCILCRRVLKRG